MKKQKISVLTLFACIFSYLSVIASIVGIIFFIFDIMNVATIYQAEMTNIGYSFVDIGSDMNIVYFQFGLSILMNMYFANFYLKGVKYKINTAQYGRSLVIQGICQILLLSFVFAGLLQIIVGVLTILAGVFAIISGSVMSKTKVKASAVDESKKSAFLSDYKLEAMSQAVARLKELKEKGVISEEEYYANLNKILEG